MSKKQPVNNEGERILKGIGERLQKQHERKPKKEKKQEKEQAENVTNQKKEVENKEEKQPDDTPRPKKNNWEQKIKSYKTTYTVKPTMEETFDRCRKKFRKELRTLLSRQDAIELGWALLKNLDDDFFEEVRENYSPEDDSIQALKDIIEKHF